MKSVLGVICICIIAFATPAIAENHVIQVITDNENGVVIFSPKILKIGLGDTVTWVNQIEDLHNMVTYPDGFPKGASGFESPYLKMKGDSWSHTFVQRGTYQYHCVPHIFMGMRGVVVVEKETAMGGFNKPTMKDIAVYRERLLDFFDKEDLEVMPDEVLRNTRIKDCPHDDH